MIAGGRVHADTFCNDLDFRTVNGVIYEDNGVKIRAFPAIHAIEGSLMSTITPG